MFNKELKKNYIILLGNKDETKINESASSIAPFLLTDEEAKTIIGKRNPFFASSQTKEQKDGLVINVVHLEYLDN